MLTLTDRIMIGLVIGIFMGVIAGVAGVHPLIAGLFCFCFIYLLDRYLSGAYHRND